MDWLSHHLIFDPRQVRNQHPHPSSKYYYQGLYFVLGSSLEARKINPAQQIQMEVR